MELERSHRLLWSCNNFSSRRNNTSLALLGNVSHRVCAWIPNVNLKLSSFALLEAFTTHQWVTSSNSQFKGQKQTFFVSVFKEKREIWPSQHENVRKKWQNRCNLKWRADTCTFKLYLLSYYTIRQHFFYLYRHETRREMGFLQFYVN